MMKLNLLKLLTFFLIVFPLSSCNDAIFFKVTEETPLLKPIIGGSPTNFVEYDSKLYVASGINIFEYGKNKENKYVWLKCELNRLDGFIMSLAATNNYLYALVLSGSNGKIGRYKKVVNDNDSISYEYEVLSSAYNYNFQSIYASGNVLFVGVRNDKDIYSIYYFDERNTSPDFTQISNATSILYGVASDNANYYLCTNSGIYYIDKGLNSPATVIQDLNINFTGIINLNDEYAAAITESGDLYVISNATIERKAGFNDSRYSTGALALYRKGNITLLLVGRRERYYSTITGYTNGYVEIELDFDEDDTGNINVIKSGATFKEPGKNPPSSIENNDRYVSSLGKKAINYIIQTPSDIDPNMTLFASTQKDGVWSYRDHNDDEGTIWNAER